MSAAFRRVASLVAVLIAAAVAGCGETRSNGPDVAAAAPEVIDLGSREDPALEARLERIHPLLYTDNGSEAEDRPPFVRAASAVRRWRGGRVVVQDDVNVVASAAEGVFDRFAPLLLPPGPDGRRRFEDRLGNTEAKLDLEAAATLPDGRLVLFGSGSTRARERIVLITPANAIRVVDARDLYGQLRLQTAFSGSELNIEGAFTGNGSLTLVQRGNGAPSEGLRPVNALGELPLADVSGWLDGGRPVPTLRRITRFNLGRMDRARLSFTDGVRRADGSTVVLACAEDSPDAVRDGELLGCRFGVIDQKGVRLTDILDEQGRAALLKLEGIELRQEPGIFDVVADADDPDKPALGGELRVTDRAKPARGR